MTSEICICRHNIIKQKIFEEELYQTIGSNSVATDKFLIRQGIFYGPDAAVFCNGGTRMYMYTSQAGKCFCRCNTRVDPVSGVRCCRGSSQSIRADSFFFNRSLDVSEVLDILFMWLKGASQKYMLMSLECSPRTIRNVLKDIRQVLQEDILEEDVQIGGPGIVVEIDESKFGKRKYHRGHRVDGVWVVGGVENTPQRKMFLTTVENRTTEVMTRIIKRFVKPGSIIYTDEWRAYLAIPRIDGYNYTHRTVNHSQHFITTEGVHTNHIEGTWNGVKMHVTARRRTRGSMPWVLVEAVWRRKHHGDLWGGLMKTLREVAFSRGTNPPKYTEYRYVPNQTERNEASTPEVSVPQENASVSEDNASNPEASNNSTDDDYIPGFCFDEDNEREEEDYSD